MNIIRTLVIIILPLCVFQKSVAQTFNWYNTEKTNQVVSAGIGWDYSVSYSLGYAHQIKAKRPILLTTHFSVPSGNNLTDDFKSKIGAQVLLLNKSKLKASFGINGIYRRYENPLVTLQNFGSEFRGTFGYYRPRWFIAVEAGFDKAIVTHFEHSDTFKNTIFRDAKNGWYEPATGGNFEYGFQTGYSFKKSDLIFRFGMVTTEHINTKPLIPYYLELGYNYRIR